MTRNTRDLGGRGFGGFGRVKEPTAISLRWGREAPWPTRSPKVLRSLRPCDSHMLDPNITHPNHNRNVEQLCTPEFNLVGARMRAPKKTRLGSVHLLGDARRTHVRRSRYLPFYDPKVEGRQVTWV
ncbi:hypothetical protein CRG98_017623 [Punica granatum]|uniref:Uncharacterized protein n=1 Tax=Punica granatum TaxID=22663 RepID=A0A2I0K0A2_PUNGR|nr:hypothetical protein CRG98_017623 [Punica granatum]